MQRAATLAVLVTLAVRWEPLVVVLVCCRPPGRQMAGHLVAPLCPPCMAPAAAGMGWALAACSAPLVPSPPLQVYQ